MKHILFLEDKSCDDTAHSCNDCREPPFRIRQSADIHAIETENDIRDCHDDGNYRQNFHHDVQDVYKRQVLDISGRSFLVYNCELKRDTIGTFSDVYKRQGSTCA